jgi:folate-binding protein YgfZ
MTMNPPISGAVALTHWGVIRALGDDAASFLQSQLTNDFSALGLSEARLAGYCSAKGRMLADFVAWKAAHDEILLACHASVLPATLKRLSMFVLRAKCKLSDASADMPLFGVAGNAARDAANGLAPWQRRSVEGGHQIRLPDAAGLPRMLVAGAAAAPAPEGLSLDTWRWLAVQSGIATIEAATVEQFVPQMLNFELVGGVNFQKGCYPGQEIVARAQYRGTVKRRMFLFDVVAATAAGQEVFHSGDPGQPAGLIANAAPSPDGAGFSVLAEIKLAALGGGSLHLGAPGGPALVRRTLPYPVPVDASQAA